MTANEVRVGVTDVEAIETVSGFERRLIERIDGAVEDPHIPVSIVELGMIYDVRERDGDVTVEMTYPCMGCPAYGMIQDDVAECLLEVDGVEDVSVEVVWDPVWSKDRLDQATREKLRGAGTAI